MDGRKPIAAIHIATGDRLPHAVAVLVNRLGQRLKRDRQGRDVVVGAFAIAPAVIASAASPRFVIDFLPAVLSDVANDERTGATPHGIVECVAPGVSQSECPDLGPRRRRSATEKRIVGRNLIPGRVGVRHVDVDAPHLAEKLLRVLRAMRRIVARTAVAEANVEEAIGPERQMTAVVIGERLRDGRRAVRAAPTQIKPRSGIGDDRRRPAEAGNDGVAGSIGEADEEAAASGRVRRERKPEQPLLAAGDNRTGNVEKVGREDCAELHDADAAILLHDELGISIGGILHDGERRREPACVRAQPQLRVQLLGDHTRKTQRDRNCTSSSHADSLTTRGATPSAFERRCIPTGCVAPPSNIPDILSRRALPAGRLAVLGATMELRHGLLSAMLRICQALFRALRCGAHARHRTLRDGGRAIVVIASALTLFATACSKSSPPPPEVTPPAGGETINGTERLGWTQRAADAVELAAVRYAIYVDGNRSELAGASCAPAAAADGFACSARLPTLTAGAHTLEIASFVTDGSLLESARSAALRVTVVTQVESAVKTGTEPLGSKSSNTTIRLIALADGTRLVVEPVAAGLNRPADLAFTPDSRLLIAQRDGTIRSVHDGTLSEPASLSDKWATGGRLLAIAIDPDFARTRFVFAIVAGGGTFSVIRVREVGGTFGDRAVLLGGISAAAVEPAASLRFGPDRRLYAAFDDGGEARQVGDAASPNGQTPRLNDDGTTPDDQAGASPIYAAGPSSPAGLDWQPGTEVLWMADAAQGGITPVTTESTDRRRIRGVARATWRLPAALVPTAMAFARGASIPALAGNLFVASGTGQRLLRVRFDPLDPSRIAATEPLLQDVPGPLVAIAARPDGAIYFATADSVWRIVPDAGKR